LLLRGMLIALLFCAVEKAPGAEPFYNPTRKMRCHHSYNLGGSAGDLFMETRSLILYTAIS